MENLAIVTYNDMIKDSYGMNSGDKFRLYQRHINESQFIPTYLESSPSYLLDYRRHNISDQLKYENIDQDIKRLRQRLNQYKEFLHGFSCVKERAGRKSGSNNFFRTPDTICAKHEVDDKGEISDYGDVECNDAKKKASSPPSTSFETLRQREKRKESEDLEKNVENGQCDKSTNTDDFSEERDWERNLLGNTRDSQRNFSESVRHSDFVESSDKQIKSSLDINDDGTQFTENQDLPLRKTTGAFRHTVSITLPFNDEQFEGESPYTRLSENKQNVIAEDDRFNMEHSIHKVINSTPSETDVFNCIENVERINEEKLPEKYDIVFPEKDQHCHKNYTINSKDELDQSKNTIQNDVDRNDCNFNEADHIKEMRYEQDPSESFLSEHNLFDINNAKSNGENGKVIKGESSVTGRKFNARYIILENKNNEQSVKVKVRMKKLNKTALTIHA